MIRGRSAQEETRITRFIRLEEQSELVLSGIAEKASIDVFDKDLSSISATSRNGDLVFDLAPGSYAVTWKPDPRDTRVSYSLLPERGG